MLTIRNVSKTYDNGVEALKQVSVEMPTGLFGLVGPNGAGKSTLMRTIATLQDPDSGTIEFNGLNAVKEKDEIRRILGYLPQEFGLYPKISALAMLDHLAVLKGITDRKIREDAVASLLQLTNLWDVRKRRLGTYSGGMRQRFGIAQALLGDPKLIIVDEPTAGLDPEERRRFMNLLGRIGESVVVILSTHIVDDVREICGNMAIIDQGHILKTGQPKDLINKLAGHVWQKAVDKSAVETYQRAMEVISTRIIGGRTVLRVLSESSPGEDFVTAPPDLEDVYFSTLGEARAGGEILQV